MKDTVRINFDFPREYYPELKKICAEKGVSLKQFATEMLIEKIEEEDRILSQKASARLNEMDSSENIDFEEAIDLAGWNDESEI